MISIYLNRRVLVMKTTCHICAPLLKVDFVIFEVKYEDWFAMYPRCFRLLILLLKTL